MRLKETPSRRREPDLTALINIIFLILIFFLIAGTLRPYTSTGLKLPKIDERETAALGPDRMIVDAEDRIHYRGKTFPFDTNAAGAAIAAAPAIDKNATFTLILDNRLDARRALELVSTLNGRGIRNIQLLTERQNR